MGHVTVENSGATMDRIGRGDNRIIFVLIGFPTVQASLRDVEDVTDIHRDVIVVEEPERVLLQILANVFEHHGSEKRGVSKCRFLLNFLFI
jgi:hypothetical protein